MTNIQLDFVRRQFPGLQTEWAYFDNAGGSQILTSVLRRINEYLATSNVQPGASYAVSRLAGRRVADAQRAVATYVNAPDVSEVVLGPSTTMLIRILAGSIGKTLTDGDEVIVTNCDHEANIGAWRELESLGARVKTWELNRDTLDLEVDDLRALLSARTRLVALTHASNVLGRINPIAEISRLVHEYGAMVCVDGVAFAPHRCIDVQELDVDFYAVSFYKVYGPHIAMLYGKREHLVRLPGINHFFIAADEVPYKFQPGNLNYELGYGLLGLWDYVEDFSEKHDLGRDRRDPREGLNQMFDVISGHEKAMASRLLEYLSSKSNIRVVGPSLADRERRVPTVSFVAGAQSSRSIVEHIDQRNIGIRFGHFYAKRLTDHLGLGDNGVVRVSMVHYNTLDEVDRLIAAFEEIL